MMPVVVVVLVEDLEEDRFLLFGVVVSSLALISVDTDDLALEPDILRPGRFRAELETSSLVLNSSCLVDTDEYAFDEELRRGFLLVISSLAVRSDVFDGEEIVLVLEEDEDLLRGFFGVPSLALISSVLLRVIVDLELVDDERL